ncbi:MAG TPA: N-acetyltransferase [Desulfobacteria bacterium]|nr:N-acetyltransferase [Desulfobacteria bacterium]
MLFRKAVLADVEAMHRLINQCAGNGLMLPRARNMLYETIRDFTVVELNGELIAAGALHIIWRDLAEVRALAVDHRYLRQGIGRGIVNQLVGEARMLGSSQVFALTYQPGFFLKCGFSAVSKEMMPQKVWKECINCPKFPNCDENAVVLPL